MKMTMVLLHCGKEIFLVISFLSCFTISKQFDSCDDIYTRLKSEINSLKVENERKFLQTETVISELKKTIVQQQIEISQQQVDIQRLQVDSVYLVNESGNVSSRQKRQVLDKVGFTYINTGDLNYLAAYTTVKFDKRITDIHGDYNPATGIFIAPVSGFYAFVLDTRALPGRHCWIDVVKDGQPIATDYIEAQSGQEDSETSFAIVHLNNGDRVWVRHSKSSNCGLDDLSNFSGFILYQDL